MKKLANTLYITNPKAYLGLEGETIVIKKENDAKTRLPLHNLENIVCFNWLGTSPSLMRACAERKIGLAYFNPYGNFQGRVSGKIRGNVLLRKTQYRISENENQCVKVAASFIIAKIANSRKVVNRALRDHSLLLDSEELNKTSSALKNLMQLIPECQHIEKIRAFEGSAAKIYFRVFDHLILQQKEHFYFKDRSRRPPLDNMNSLLSFYYTLLANDVASALEGVGLDPYVGFLHQDRPGRPSLALDMMEEMRPIFADRLALNLINRKQINHQGFTKKENGSVLMNEDTRKKVLIAWQERKQDQIMHPFLKERISFGLIPHVQALLLARYLRGDLDAYPPFFWRY
jgi:CRISP-associated protein Cas1